MKSDDRSRPRSEAATRVSARLIATVTAALLLAFLVVACGGDDDESGEAGGGESGPSVGMAAIGPVNDKAFTQAHYEGAQAGVEATGGELAEPIENLEDPQARIDAFRNLAPNNDLVIGASATFNQAAETLAEQFPDTFFIVSAGATANGYENVLSIVPDEGVPAYINGVVAAMTTETGQVGVIGGAEIPPTTQSIAGFKAGVESVDPGIQVSETIVGNFNDVAKAKAAAKAMIDDGVDNIFAFLDAGIAGVYQAGNEADGDVLVSGIIVPQCEEYANYLGVSTLHNDVLIENAIEDFANGELEPGAIFYGVEDPEIQAFDLCPKFREGELQQAVEETTEQINSGEIELPAEGLNERPDYYEEPSE